MAKADFRGALEGFRAAADRRGEAVTLILLATVEVNLDNVPVARDHLRNASSMFRERKDIVGIWLALTSLAQLERATGHYGAALASQDEAQRVIETAINADEAVSLEAFNLMASAFGLPGFDLTGAPTGADLYLRAFVLPGVARPLTHHGYAGILIEVGQYERAEKELHAALATAGPFAEHYQYAVAAHFGELRYRQRRFAEARAYYEQAVQGSLRMPLNPLCEQWIKVGIYGRLAELDAAENRIDEAFAWNDRALQAVRAGENQLKEAAVLEERGLLLIQGGRLAEAENALQQALEIAAAIQSDTRSASIESRLADVSFLTGNYGTAVSHLEEAIRLHQSLHDQVTEGLAWSNLAVMYMLASMDDAAGVLLTQARALAEVSAIDLVCDVVTFLEIAQKFRKGTAGAGEL
ncbi:MAG TPA: tetratricopeptide repeat protein, partial [Thermoanaerobaculia bacterium]|nr:tetratricopeptide repeat protein [Thermoanaerobaculia bacterium]